MNYYIKYFDRQLLMSRKQYFEFQDKYPVFSKYEKHDESGLFIDLSVYPVCSKFYRFKWCLHHLADTCGCTMLGLLLCSIVFGLVYLLFRGFCSFWSIS